MLVGLDRFRDLDLSLFHVLRGDVLGDILHGLEEAAVLVEYNEGFEGEVAVADLFMSVANTYLVDEEDPYEVSFPVSLYFVGESVGKYYLASP